MSTPKTTNPALPSPWTSRAPRGFRHLSRKLSLLSHFNENSSNAATQTVRPRVQRHRNVLKENAFFKNLNRNTLILSFPEVHPNQIDAALTLCDNDLSETISLLQLRVRVLKNRKVHMEKRNAYNCTQFAPANNAPPKIVKYIPTKYNDVHIVEVTNNNINNNQIKVMEVNKNVLQMLETCKTTMLHPSKTASEDNLQPLTTRTVASSGSKIGIPSESEFSPTTTISSSVRSDDSEKLKVLNITNGPEMQECIVVSPNIILERALTFSIPFSPDNN